jgi:hypothetical protein
MELTTRLAKKRLHPALRVLREDETWRRLNYMPKENKTQARWFQVANTPLVKRVSRIDQRVNKLEETRWVIQGISWTSDSRVSIPTFLKQIGAW